MVEAHTGDRCIRGGSKALGDIQYIHRAVHSRPQLLRQSEFREFVEMDIALAEGGVREVPSACDSSKQDGYHLRD